MTIELTILGIDVSKSSVTTHILTQYPKGGLQAYWNKTRNKASTLYPAFYSNPDAKKKQKSAFDFANYLAEIKPDYAILEPTGNHYSRREQRDFVRSDKKGAIAKTHTSVQSYFLSIKGTKKTRQLTLKINLKRMFGK